MRQNALWRRTKNTRGRALFFLGQDGALEAIQARLRPSERLMAFLDDIWCVSSPERTAAGVRLQFRNC